MLGSDCFDRSAAVTAGPNACNPPGGHIESASRSDVVSWASGLPYAAPDPARAYVYGFPPGDSVVIESVNAASVSTLSPSGCVIARLTSGVARPASGIGVGKNYIWVDSLTGGTKTVIIPEDTTVSITVHAVGLHAHTASDPPIAQVGALGYCGYCDKTARTWCRAGLDSLGTTSLSALSGLTK
jgi:hypothetical protein